MRRETAAYLLASPQPASPSPADVWRRAAVALLPAVVIAFVLTAGPRPTLATVVPVHLATVLGALVAFWLVPRRPAGDPLDTFDLLRGICIVLLVAGIVWGFAAGVWAADVREAALPWALLLFDAAFLFLLANRGARHAPYQATLACLALMLLGAWGPPSAHRGVVAWRAFESPRRTAFTPRLQRLASESLGANTLCGIGLGNLDSRATAQGIPVVGAVWPRPVDPALAPEQIAPALERPSTGAEAPARPSVSAPPQLSSLALYTVEVGLAGMALAFAFAAYLAATALYAIVRTLTARTRTYESPAIGLALLALGVLAVWTALLGYGLRGDFLREPLGILSVSVGGGLLWGLVRRLLAAGVPRAAAALATLETATSPASPPMPEGPRLAPAPLRRWWRLVPVPFGLALVLAGYLPLRGARLAEAVARTDGATPAAIEAQLRRAARLNPFSSEARFRLAQHLEAGIATAGSGASAQGVRAEDAYYAARRCDPYRDDIAAAQARFHLARQENLKMATTIADGLRRSPESLLLTLWVAQAAEVNGNSPLLEAAWEEAVRLALAERPSVAVYLLERLAEVNEEHGNYARALDLARLLYEIRPGNLRAWSAVVRLAPRASASASAPAATPASPARRG